jgi:hypothetical protein
MALKIKQYSKSELEYIDRSVNEGKSWSVIGKALKRSEHAVYQRYRKYVKNNDTPKVITVDNSEVNSVILNIKGVEITMVFK